MLAKWMPPGSGMEPLQLFRTLGVHDKLASWIGPFGAAILGRSPGESRLRQVMIHRTCVLTEAEYEWGVHVVGFGKPLGFSEAQLASTVSGSADDGVWDEREAAVFRLADELHHTSSVSDELFAQLAGHLAADQIVELVITACRYRTTPTSSTPPAYGWRIGRRDSMLQITTRRWREPATRRLMSSLARSAISNQERIFGDRPLGLDSEPRSYGSRRLRRWL